MAMGTGVDFSNTAIDPVTGLPKKKNTTLPYLNEPGASGTGILPYTPPAQATTESLAQGNKNVLGAAQGAALAPANNDIQNNTADMVRKMQVDPNFGWDAQKNKAGAMSSFDLDRSNALKAQRQTYGDIGGSGKVQEGLLNTVMQGNIDRSKLENTLDTQAYETAKKNWQDAITAGNTQSAADSGLNTAAINNLLNVRSAGEGERSQTQATTDNVMLTNLGYDHATQAAATQQGYDLAKMDKTFGHDDATLLSTQGWQTGENNLNRMAAIALQKGDIEGQKQIAALQQTFSNNQRIATQSWQTGERIGSEDAAKAAQYFDAKNKELLQANDLEGQKVLTTLKAGFDLNQLTASMSHDEKMKYLDSQYTEAKANNDVNRQKNILAFTYTQDIAKMTAEQGFDLAKISAQGKIQEALQAGDFEHADAMQEALFKQQSSEATKDREIEKARVELQAKGVDMEKFSQDYKSIADLVERGLANPSVLENFMKKSLSGTGVTITPPDALAAEKESEKAFAGLQSQFLLSHPNYIDPTTKKISIDGKAAFNDFYNKSMFGEGKVKTPEQIEEKAQMAINDSAKYEQLLSDPTVKEWVPEMSYNDGGWFGADFRSFSNAPAQNSIIKYGGVAYQVMGPPVMDAKGENSDKIQVKNLKDCTMHTVGISGDHNGQLTVQIS